MKLTTLISQLQIELQIYNDELYLVSFISSLQDEQSSNITYPELIRRIELNFSTTTELRLPKDFLYVILPYLHHDHKDAIYLTTEPTFATTNTIIAKLEPRSDGYTYAIVKEPYPTPVTLVYYSKHLYKFRDWEPNLTVTANSYLFYDFRYYKVISAGTLGLTPPIHTSGTQTNGTASLEYLDNVYDFYDFGLYDHIYCLYPANICRLAMMLYIKRKRGLDFSVELEMLNRARGLYAGKNVKQISLGKSLPRLNRNKEINYL